MSAVPQHPGEAPRPSVAPRPRGGDADTIFVSVASYRDPMLRFTLTSALTRAARPGRVHVGVVEQGLAAERLQLHADWAAGIRWTRIDAAEARGPCWARALAMALYEGEDWYLQVDSHTWFEPGWDERLVRQAAALCAEEPRTLLSCYPNPFVMRGSQPFGHVVTRGVLAHALRDDCRFDPAHPVLMFEGVPVETHEPLPALHVAAGALFAPGCFVQELPYDPQLYFHGEEQSIALRAYTRGWRLLHPPAMPLFHLYTEAGAAPRPLHWDAGSEAARRGTAARLMQRANERLRALLWEGSDLGIYGLGQARSLDEYAEFSGIDYRRRRISPRAGKQRFGL